MKTPTKAIAIVGPTASGKSDLALTLAARRDCEIVSCDSVQVYRGFDVGTAKPSTDERARIRHHLVDVVDWDEPFDAARYAELARDAMVEIKTRGAGAILCGGTGLYLRALRFGLVDVPPTDLELRGRMAAQEAAEPGVLSARLARLDPESARSIEPRNLVQVIRALEIFELTGERASQIRARHGFQAEVVPMRVVVLHRDREILRQRIARRAAAMLEAGLLEEVAALLAAGVRPDCRPMSSVGYREACAVLRGQEPTAGLAERITTSTWHYAKRQLTWFRKEREVVVFAPAAEHSAGAAVDELARLLDGSDASS